MYGQVELVENLSDKEIEAATDQRGVVSRDVAEMIRSSRQAEKYGLNDAHLITPNASNIDNGYSVSWQDLADTGEMKFFVNRSSKVGQDLSNFGSDRRDFAYDLEEISVSFKSPEFPLDYMSSAIDGTLVSQIFRLMFADQSQLGLKIGDVDDTLSIPVSRAPSGSGPSGVALDGNANSNNFYGTNGVAALQNSWKFDVPIMIAARGKFEITIALSRYIKQILNALPPIGNAIIPNGNGGVTQIPLQYMVRVDVTGTRYVAFRGQYTAG